MTDTSLFDEIRELLEAQHRSEADIADIKRAFDYAAKLHEGQYRISEEPYIIHPVEVAKILIDLMVDKNTIIAALLHDIIEVCIREGLLLAPENKICAEGTYMTVKK